MARRVPSAWLLQTSAGGGFTSPPALVCRRVAWVVSRFRRFSSQISAPIPICSSTCTFYGIRDVLDSYYPHSNLDISLFSEHLTVSTCRLLVSPCMCLVDILHIVRPKARMPPLRRPRTLSPFLGRTSQTHPSKVPNRGCTPHERFPRRVQQTGKSTIQHGREHTSGSRLRLRLYVYARQVRSQ